MDSTHSHPLLPILDQIPYQPGRTFLHQVESDQWKELGVRKQDRLLIEFRPLKEGDLALILHHGQAILTRYHHLPQTTFTPPSPLQPIQKDDAVLQGVVTCLVRTM